MRRHTIASLMAVTVIIAVAVAALKNASDVWAGGLLLITLFLLASAVLGVRYRREARQAFWFGFALFGWGYLVLAEAPWFAEHVRPGLPTTALLSYLHAKISPHQVDSTNYVVGLSSLALADSPPLGSFKVATKPGTSVNGSSSVVSSGLSFAFSVGLFRSNVEQFTHIGHCLLALLAAVAGGLVARWFQRTGSTASTPTSAA